MRVGSMFAGYWWYLRRIQPSRPGAGMANEIDRYACSTYRHNFGSDFLMEGDIKKILDIDFAQKFRIHADIKNIFARMKNFSVTQ